MLISLLLSAIEIANACLEPAAERAVGLIAQPSPGEFDHLRARLGIVGLADALVAIDADLLLPKWVEVGPS